MIITDNHCEPPRARERRQGQEKENSTCKKQGGDEERTGKNVLELSWLCYNGGCCSILSGKRGPESKVRVKAPFLFIFPNST